MRSSDLSPFLHPAPAGDPLGFHQGTVVAWDNASNTNTIDVGGTQLTNVPVLNAGTVQALTAGQVVALLTWQGSWFVLGRLTPPGTA